MIEEKPLEALLIVSDTLNSLKQQRRGPKKWEDDRSFSARENNAYAVLQAIATYLHAQMSNPTHFANIPLSYSEIEEDILYVIGAINKDGFYPSPYLTSTKKEGLVDFAAFALTTFVDFTNVYRDKEIDKNVADTIKKAFDFLLESSYQDANGRRWPGTNVSEKKRIGFGHVYFTSLAISALYNAVENYDFAPAEKQQARECIESAGIWFKNQYKDGRFYSDDKQTTGATLDIVSYNYVLNGLFKTWGYHKEEVQKVAIEGLKTFISDIKTKREAFEIIIYHLVPTEAGGPLPYDDRTNIADCLSTLCLAKEVGISADIIGPDYYEYMTTLYYDIINYKRDPRNKLWKIDEMRIYWTLAAVDALLNYAKYGTPEELIFSESEFRDAIKRALSSDRIYYAVLDEARKTARRRAVGEIEK